MPSATVVTLLLAVDADALPYNPYEEYAEDGEDEEDDAGVQVVAFDAAPHFEDELGAVAEVADHGTALYDAVIGVLDRVDADAVGTGAEEVAEVGIGKAVGALGIVGIPGFLNLGFHDFGSCYSADVTDGFHVAQGNVRLAKVVDEVAGGFHVAGILGDGPAVVPDITAFAGDDIVEGDTDGPGFVNGPNGIAAPGEVEPGFVFGHHLFAEVGFPAGNVGFHGFQVFFGQGDGFGGVIVHELLYGDGAVGQLAGMGVDDGGAVGIAVAVFHEDFATVDGIPKATPGGDFFEGFVFLVIEDAGGAPHVGNDVIVGMAAGLADFLQFAADVGGDVGDIVGGAAEVAVDGEEEVFLQHALDDVLGGTDEVEVFLTALDLGEHDFVDIEYLVDDADVFAGLLLVPGGEFGEDFFVDVVAPVVDFEDAAALLGAGGTGGGKEEGNEA